MAQRSSWRAAFQELCAQPELRSSLSAAKNTPDRALELVQEFFAALRQQIAQGKSAQALALIRGIEFVTPDIIQELALPIIAHRLALNSDSTFSGSSAMNLLQTIIENTAVPV